MQRPLALASLLALAGCSADKPEAKLCNMPVGLRGWGGVTLRLTGIVKGGFEHGFTMMDEHCARGGDLLLTSQTISGDRMLNRLGLIGQSVGITRMDVAATIETDAGARGPVREGPKTYA